VEDKPSDVFRAHCHVVPFHEDVMAPLADLIGVDRMLFGSDYPHGEGLAVPNEFADHLGGMSADDVRLIMRDNAAKLLALH
jgi:predicted TIM-barrel fold metal-dependent hydrolase